MKDGKEEKRYSSMYHKGDSLSAQAVLELYTNIQLPPRLTRPTASCARRALLGCGQQTRMTMLRATVRIRQCFADRALRE